MRGASDSGRSPSPRAKPDAGRIIAGHRIAGVVEVGSWSCIARGTRLDDDLEVLIAVAGVTRAVELVGPREIAIPQVRGPLPVLAAGREADLAYTVSESPGRGVLSEILEDRERFALVEALKFLAPLVRALEGGAAACGSGHLDLHPGCILGGDPATVSVAGWGLASLLTRAEVAQRGDNPYLPPEAGGPGDDVRVDVYAVGALLFRMITGAAPVRLRLGKGVRTLADLPEAHGVAPSVLRLLCYLTAFDPNLRPQSYAELSDALEGTGTGNQSRVVRGAGVAAEDEPVRRDAGSRVPVLPPGYPTFPVEPVDAEGEGAPQVRKGMLRRLWPRRWTTPVTEGDVVDCTVYAPPHVVQATPFLVQAFMHEPASAADADDRALAFDEDARPRGRTSLQSRIRRNQSLSFLLTMPGAVIEDPQQTLIWQGRTDAVTFGVEIPESTTPGACLGKITVARENCPIGHVRFKVTTKPFVQAVPADAEPTGTPKRYRHAFVSYASVDRSEVLRRVQMLDRVGISYFQDVISLDPGQRWERQIYRNIEKADVLFLFWSRAAADSKWVRKEVDYALSWKKGDEEAPPEICPIPLELPVVKPPKALAHLHFNDRMLYFLQ